MTGSINPRIEVRVPATYKMDSRTLAKLLDQLHAASFLFELSIACKVEVP